MYHTLHADKSRFTSYVLTMAQNSSQSERMAKVRPSQNQNLLTNYDKTLKT